MALLTRSSERARRSRHSYARRRSLFSACARHPADPPAARARARSRSCVVQVLLEHAAHQAAEPEEVGLRRDEITGGVDDPGADVALLLHARRAQAFEQCGHELFVPGDVELFFGSGDRRVASVAVGEDTWELRNLSDRKRMGDGTIGVAERRQQVAERWAASRFVRSAVLPLSSCGAAPGSGCRSPSPRGSCSPARRGTARRRRRSADPWRGPSARP